MLKGRIIAGAMLIAGSASLAGQASADDRLMAPVGTARLIYDSSRPLIVLGQDAQGRRIANVYAPNTTQPSHVVYFDKPPANHARDIPQAWYQGTIDRNAFNAHILAASSVHGVDPDLIRAVIHAESAFNPNAVSSAGAAGLMQLMPSTAERMGVRDRFDPVQNVYGGTRYLKTLLEMFDYDIVKTLAAYNAGEQAVIRHGGIPPYSETQSYVPKVLALYQRYKNAPSS
jgi:soluble lytic murein transglycosylase-like protein